MTYQLRTRKPTGRVPWPLILIEGPEKAGKSWMCAELSASDRVGQTYWIDLGEGSADEYGAVPGARYLIVEHDGSFASILQSVEAVKAEAQRAAAANEPPVVLVIDSMTAEWELLKGVADAKARQRLARKGRRIDPDAEPQISMDLWNEVNAKHRKLMTLLMTMPGIVVMTARGKDVTALDANGRPVEGSKEYKVEGQKNLAFDASVWIRVSREHPPLVVGARSVHAGIRPGVDRPVPSPGLTLERVVFEILRCDPGEAHVRDLVQPATTAADLADEQPAARPAAAPDPNSVRDWALASGRTADGVRQALARLRREHPAVADAVVVSETGDEESLAALMERRARELTPAPASEPQADQAPADAQEARRRKRMHALMSEAGCTTRDQRLTLASMVVGRDIDSSSDLSAGEVEQVITSLEQQLRNRAGVAA